MVRCCVRVRSAVLTTVQEPDVGDKNVSQYLEVGWLDAIRVTAWPMGQGPHKPLQEPPGLHSPSALELVIASNRMGLLNIEISQDLAERLPQKLRSLSHIKVKALEVLSQSQKNLSWMGL